MSRAKVTFSRERFEARVIDGIEKAARATGLQAEAVLKTDILNRPGQGKEYPRGRTKTHRASAPGDTPAPDSGTLRNSASSEVVIEGDEVVSRAIVNSQYALPLDQGTERIAPRPFRQLTLNEMVRAFPAALRRFLS